MHGRAERLIFLFWNVSNSRAGRYIGGLNFVRNRASRHFDCPAQARGNRAEPADRRVFVLIHCKHLDRSISGSLSREDPPHAVQGPPLGMQECCVHVERDVVAQIRAIDRVLRLISHWIDKCIRLIGLLCALKPEVRFCSLKSQPQKRARLEFEADWDD